MTQALFGIFVALIICGGIFSAWICRRQFLAGRFSGSDVVVPPSAATISLLFGLFVAFGTSEIGQRSRELNLAVQKEISVARSIVKLAESVGASANPISDSLTEYLQAVTTLEQSWLEEEPRAAESPAQLTADAMVQVVTLFIVQSPASEILRAS